MRVLGPQDSPPLQLVKLEHGWPSPGLAPAHFENSKTAHQTHRNGWSQDIDASLRTITNELEIALALDVTMPMCTAYLPQ